MKNKHIYSTDEKPVTKMQVLGWFIIVLSCLIGIWLILLLVGYRREIINLVQIVFSFILMNKYAGGFTMLVLLTIVFFCIKYYAAKNEF
jgi:hypothetical protein